VRVEGNAAVFAAQTRVKAGRAAPVDPTDLSPSTCPNGIASPRSTATCRPRVAGGSSSPASGLVYKPFLFFVCDRASDLVLFAGRVKVPRSQSQG
jgi:hypothetical protein